MKLNKIVTAAVAAGALVLSAGAIAPASAHSDKANVVFVAAEAYEAAYAQYLIDLAAYQVAEDAWELLENPIEAAYKAELTALKLAFKTAYSAAATAEEKTALKTQYKIDIAAAKAVFEAEVAALGVKPVKPAKPVVAGSSTSKPSKPGKPGRH